MNNFFSLVKLTACLMTDFLHALSDTTKFSSQEHTHNQVGSFLLSLSASPFVGNHFYTECLTAVLFLFEVWVHLVSRFLGVSRRYKLTYNPNLATLTIECCSNSCPYFRSTRAWESRMCFSRRICAFSISLCRIASMISI